MNKYENLFELIANESQSSSVGKLFGARSIKCPNGKNAAVFWKGSMMFKLPPDELKAAIEKDETTASVHLHDESKSMGGWVTISNEHIDVWRHYAEIAISYVSSL